MADNIANRAKEVAKEDAERMKVLAQDAYQSRAYLYPIKVWIYETCYRGESLNMRRSIFGFQNLEYG